MRRAGGTAGAALAAAVFVLATSPAPAMATPGDSTAALSDTTASPAPADTAAAAAKAAGTKATTDSKSQPKGKKPMTVPGTMPTKPAMAPAHIEVQHILIGFVGSVPGKPITRTKEQAKKLAYEILSEARQGANFDSLVAKYTDDRPPGIYKMAATGVSHAVGEYPREQMVPAFGDVGFAISPGNIDIADHDPAKSPYGWHIIKRLR